MGHVCFLGENSVCNIVEPASCELYSIFEEIQCEGPLQPHCQSGLHIHLHRPSLDSRSSLPDTRPQGPREQGNPSLAPNVGLARRLAIPRMGSDCRGRHWQSQPRSRQAYRKYPRFWSNQMKQVAEQHRLILLFRPKD